MLDGEAAVDIQVGITTNAFLEQEGSFWLNLTRVMLSSSKHYVIIQLPNVILMDSERHFTDIRVVFSKNWSPFNCVSFSATGSS